MEKIERYRTIIKQVLGIHADRDRPNDPIATYFVTDDEHGHYMLMNSGWRGSERHYGCYIHLAIRNEKVYVERDATDWNITQDLLDAGIQNEEIVLSFIAPTRRKDTDFAIV